MTEQEIKRSLNLVRYGGVVITVTVLVVLFAFAYVVGSNVVVDGQNAAGSTISQLMPYIIGFTVLAAVLSVILYFGYRAVLMGRLKK